MSEHGQKAPNVVYLGRFFPGDRDVAIKRFNKFAWPDARQFLVRLASPRLLSLPLRLLIIWVFSDSGCGGAGRSEGGGEAPERAAGESHRLLLRGRREASGGRVHAPPDSRQASLPLYGSSNPFLFFDDQNLSQIPKLGIQMAGDTHSLSWAMRIRVALYLAQALEYCSTRGRALYHDLNAYRVLFDQVVSFALYSTIPFCMLPPLVRHCGYLMNNTLHFAEW